MTDHDLAHAAWLKWALTDKWFQHQFACDTRLEPTEANRAEFVAWLNKWAGPSLQKSEPGVPLGSTPLLTGTAADKGRSLHSSPLHHDPSVDAQHDNQNNNVASVQFDFTKGLSFSGI